MGRPAKWPDFVSMIITEASPHKVQIFKPHNETGRLLPIGSVKPLAELPEWIREAVAVLDITASYERVPGVGYWTPTYKKKQPGKAYVIYKPVQENT